MDDFLNLIGNSALLINLVALVIYQFIVQKRTAFSVILMMVCVLDIAHTLYQVQIEKLYNIEAYEDLVSALWYLGFAFTNLIFVYLGIKICTKQRLTTDRVSSFILLSYFFLAIVQLARYADRYIIETDVLAGAYRVAVSTLNVGVTVMVVVFVFTVVSKHFKLSVYDNK